jgi:hypothetical protein
MREEYSRSGINYDGARKRLIGDLERYHMAANAGATRQNRVHPNARVWTIDCRIPAE